MRRRSAIALATVAWLVALPTLATRAGGVLCWIEEAEQGGTLDADVAELRDQGPAGLAEVLERYDALIAQVAERNVEFTPASLPSDNDLAERERGNKAIKRMKQVVAEVAGQRDAHIARLYWYTDLEHAKQAAADAGKPILSLRMLGELTGEHSCANSRFFRTALYSNKRISDYLRDNYILHWQSVRPVPKITVDFGDGRKLERTITGNSAHYILSATGQPLEALPGLYGPKAFQNWLIRSKDLAKSFALAADRGSIAQMMVLHEYHTGRVAAIDSQIAADLAVHAPQMLDATVQTKSPLTAAAPTAHEAGFRATSKFASERPILAHIEPVVKLSLSQDDELWTRIAAAHAGDAQLDETSRELIRAENPTLARAAMRAAISKRRVEDPLARMIDDFQQSMAVDTLKNEYLLHRTIHRWFSQGEPAASDVNALNERVYAELFLTPSSDPWLGLAPTNVYTALNNGGVVD